ncbi:MAG: hypothetical protein M2R45_00344 [Verrucomicrobia subdivision 3 bacterium]|nr:hypothetical protein [Limisphaerales bacterium]MCS1412898.1 hypothetical protein [Limisphaerales bacterium]
MSPGLHDELDQLVKLIILTLCDVGFENLENCWRAFRFFAHFQFGCLVSS